MSRTPCEGRGDWVTLLGGVRVSRRWMSQHTPQLLAAWCDADSASRRRAIAARILQVAAELESERRGGEADEVLLQTWRAAVERVDGRLTHGVDWPPLAAALARAQAAGYEFLTRLPALAATPLPDRHPARELHWRLLDDCPAALPAPSDRVRFVAPADRDMDTAPPAVHRSAVPPSSVAGGGARSTENSPAPEGDL